MERELQIKHNGTKYWYQNDKLHRDNGPAVIYNDGEKRWYINGKLHRENGPAIIYPDGSKKWYIKDKFIKLLYEGKEYDANEDPCKLCLVKVMCKQRCKLKYLLLYNYYY